MQSRGCSCLCTFCESSFWLARFYCLFAENPTAHEHPGRSPRLRPSLLAEHWSWSDQGLGPGIVA